MFRAIVKTTVKKKVSVEAVLVLGYSGADLLLVDVNGRVFRADPNLYEVRLAFHVDDPVLKADFETLERGVVAASAGPVPVSVPVLDSASSAFERERG